MASTNANSYPDGQRGQVRSRDTGRVADYAASTLPVRGPGVLGRRFPRGSTVTVLPTRQQVAAAIPALTVIDASAKDAQGNPHPGRIRVYNGDLGNLTPAEMTVPDAVLPDGTDNHCYLTVDTGTSYVYGKVAVDADSGIYTGANVYVVTSTEEADGTYVYLRIAIVVRSESGVSIEQKATGNQSLAVLCSADGTVLTPIWNPLALAS